MVYRVQPGAVAKVFLDVEYRMRIATKEALALQAVMAISDAYIIPLRDTMIRRDGALVMLFDEYSQYYDKLDSVEDLLQLGIDVANVRQSCLLLSGTTNLSVGIAGCACSWHCSLRCDSK